MNGVRTACVSGWNTKSNVSVYLNLSVLQQDGEPAGDGYYWLLADWVFSHKHRPIFQGSRKVQVDQWKNMKSIVIEDFVNAMFSHMGVDIISREEVIDLVDQIFKNNDNYCTPLVLAAEQGTYHAIH